MGQSAPLERQSVLVIEDEPVLRIDALDMVERAGFEAVEALTVDDAIRILETRFDIRIVYMNLDMPRGLKGIVTAAAIRDRWPPIEIILTAAWFPKAGFDIVRASRVLPQAYCSRGDHPGSASDVRCRRCRARANCLTLEAG